MVPNSWKRQQVVMTSASGQRVGESELRDFDESGIVLNWEDGGRQRTVFFPWHSVDALELVDPDAAKPNV
jgi:hypothetical protein